MKKLFTLILGLGMVAGANAQNPFAYGLSTDGNVVSPSEGVLTVKVNYSLNADAESVNALIKNAEGEVVKTQPLSGIKKGTYENVELDLIGIGHGDFTWAIEVKGGATSGDLLLFETLKFFHPSGLDVDNSSESPSFGTLFIAEGYTNGKTSGYVSAQADGSEGNGLYMYDAARNQITDVNGAFRFYPSELTFSKAIGTSTSGADFARVAVAEDGRIFVTRHNDSGDYILSAESVEALQNGESFTSLVAGRTMASTKYYTDDNGDFLVGPNMGFDVKGAGEDTKILALSCPNNANSMAYVYRTMEYEIGTAETLPAGTAVTGLDQKYTIAYDRSVNVTYDNRGGIWYCQSRQTPSDKQPALVYIDANGNELYKDITTARRRGAVSVSPDGQYLVTGSAYSAGKFSVYEITHSDNSVSLTEKYTASPGGNNLYALTWDVAGNLYCANASSEYVKGYAMPRANNVFATPAASKYTLKIDSATAIGEINTDANAPIEYYNLQGVKVENPAGGIFIRKQGSKTTKVVL